jgi:uncharacterized glyoxalase superfamily protein PhnB
MTKNRSVPTDTMLVHLAYRDVATALGWLSDTFGFAEHYRFGEPGEPLNGAQMRAGDGWIMLRAVDDDLGSPAAGGRPTQSVTIIVDDVEGHFERSKSAGADIVEDLNVAVYGELQYGVKDLDGHHWLFSAHAKDVDPKDWGATVAGE